jgi:LCP family protein required for cell wall assembly
MLVEANHLQNPNAIYVGEELLIPVPPTATASPTPLPPTSTSTPAPPTPTPHASDRTLAATPTPWPTPTGIGAYYAPWPFGAGPVLQPLPLPPHLITIVLVGKDAGTTPYRTDTIVLLTINPDVQRAGLLSIPRDLWVSIPGYGEERINTVDFRGESTQYPGGGAALLKRTIRENLGIPVHYYARIDFRSFQQLIDTLGGIDVPVDCNLRDSFLDSSSPTGVAPLNVTPGVYHMDGATALRYARSRHTTNDFDRARRQQQILKAAWQKALSLDLVPKIPQLWQEFRDSIKTDLGLDDILALARFGTDLHPQAIQSRVIDWRVTRNWTTPMGAMVLLPDQKRIHDLLSEYFTELQKPVPVSKGGAVGRVVVENDTSVTDWTDLVAMRLRWRGLEVSSIDTPQRHDRQVTQLIDYTGNTEAIKQVQDEFSLQPGQIVAQHVQDSPVDLRLVIGYDLKTCRRWAK